MTGYAWVDALEAYCFTAVVGPDPDETIRRLGGDPGSWQARTFDECFWAANGPHWVQVDRVDGAHNRVLVAEHNGWRAEEAVETLSRNARVACFYRNVQAVMHFVYAVDGAVLAEFDPLLDTPPMGAAPPAAGGSRAGGGPPDLLGQALNGLPFGLFGAESSALTLLERLTGVRVTRAWLDAKQRAVPLPPLR
jgi:hypothetical protein